MKLLLEKLACGFTTYCPFVAERMSSECSNSLVIDSIVLAGLGSAEAVTDESVDVG